MTYIHTERIDPSAHISKEDAAKQAVELGIRFFDALGIEVAYPPVSVSRPYDREAYLAHCKEVYTHRYSDPSVFMEQAKENWKKTMRYETRSAEYTKVTFAVMVDGMRIWTQPSYPAGYSDEPDAQIGFEVSASVLVSDSGVLVEATASHIPQMIGARQLNAGKDARSPALCNELSFPPLIRAESWEDALNTLLQDASKNGILYKNAEDQPYQNRNMDEPLLQYGYQNVITSIYPCLSTVSKNEWAMFWHIQTHEQYSDGWRYKN